MDHAITGFFSLQEECQDPPTGRVVAAYSGGVVVFSVILSLIVLYELEDFVIDLRNAVRSMMFRKESEKRQYNVSAHITS